MSRIRTIKPEFWTDDTLIECSLSTRLLFIGMWNFADDFGNLERSSKQLKMRVFPADDVDVEACVQELLSTGRVWEYSADGGKYLHIKNFPKHQRINRPSNPSFPLHDDSVSTQGGNSEDSPPEGKGREGKGKECASRFDDFWKVWPKKKAKPDAQKAWEQMGCDEIADDLIAHVCERKARDPDWLKEGGKFIPHAGTFLRGERWKDEWESASGKTDEEVVL